MTLVTARLALYAKSAKKSKRKVQRPNHKLPRLVKLNPGMNTMSLSFKPTMSLSLTDAGLSRNDSGSTLASLSSLGDRQSDETLDLNSSADEMASDSTSSNASSKKSSTSTITR